MGYSSLAHSVNFLASPCHLSTSSLTHEPDFLCSVTSTLSPPQAPYFPSFTWLSSLFPVIADWDILEGRRSIYSWNWVASSCLKFGKEEKNEWLDGITNSVDVFEQAPVVCDGQGSLAQRVGHDRQTELNWSGYQLMWQQSTFEFPHICDVLVGTKQQNGRNLKFWMTLWNLEWWDCNMSSKL